MMNETTNTLERDLREDLLDDILQTLYAYGIEDSGELKNAIAFSISNYDISIRCTDLATLETNNADIIDMFLISKRIEGGSLETAKTRRYIYDSFCAFIDKPLTETTNMDVLRWLAYLQRTRKLSTCNSYRSIIASLFNWMYQKQYIKLNPMENTKPIKHDESIENGLNSVELDAIRSQCKKTLHRAVVELLFSSGMRAAELCNLKWSDVNLVTNEITIREGKGGKSRFTLMSDVAKRYLLEWKQQLKHPSEYIFATYYNGEIKQRTTDSLWLMLRKLGVKANVNHVHPHRLRHTAASTLMKSGVSITTIQRFLGHSSPNVTQRYLDRDAEFMKTEYRMAFN